MTRSLQLGVTALALSWAAMIVPATAQVFVSQDPCCVQQAYRISYRTVYDERQVTAYRVEYETTYETQKRVAYRPQLFTETKQRRYTVQRPETVTSYRIEYRTMLKPQTTTRTQYVDQGCYEDQQVVVPGHTSYRLRWQRAALACDPATGAQVYQPGGLYWVAHQGPSRTHVERVWRPQMVEQQVPCTTYVPETTAHQVPVQVCRMVCEERVEDVPVQVCRMVAVEQTVQVPRTVAHRVPVTYTCRVPRLVACCEPICCDPCGGCAGCSIAVGAPAASSGVQPAPAQGAAPPAAGQSVLDGSPPAGEGGKPSIKPDERVPDLGTPPAVKKQGGQ